MRAGVAAAVEALGGLDVLVNAAGILRSSHTHETSLADFNQVIRINLVGTFLMIRESIPALLEGDGGRRRQLQLDVGHVRPPLHGGLRGQQGRHPVDDARPGRRVQQAGHPLHGGAARIHLVRHDRRLRRQQAEQRPRPARGRRHEPVHEARAGDRPGLRGAGDASRPSSRCSAREDGAFITGTEVSIDGGTHF